MRDRTVHRGNVTPVTVSDHEVLGPPELCASVFRLSFFLIRMDQKSFRMPLLSGPSGTEKTATVSPLCLSFEEGEKRRGVDHADALPETGPRSVESHGDGNVI